MEQKKARKTKQINKEAKKFTHEFRSKEICSTGYGRATNNQNSGAERVL